MAGVDAVASAILKNYTAQIVVPNQPRRQEWKGSLQSGQVNKNRYKE